MATPEGLAVLAAIVLHGPAGPDEVAGRTGMKIGQVQRTLGRLVAAGVVGPADENSGDRVVVQMAVMRDAARQASRLRPAVDPIDLGASPRQATVLRAFMDDGRLRSIPTQRTKRMVVLDFLAQQFEPGQVYKEEEVNRLLGRYHPDYAALRRFLVDEDFLERRQRFYWRTGGTFEV